LALTLTVLGLAGATIGTMAAFGMPFYSTFLILAVLVAGALDLRNLAIRYPLAAATKVLSFDQTEQNRAEGFELTRRCSMRWSMDGELGCSQVAWR
jgi:hypothetical protein